MQPLPSRTFPRVVRADGMIDPVLVVVDAYVPDDLVPKVLALAFGDKLVPNVVGPKASPYLFDGVPYEVGVRRVLTLQAPIRLRPGGRCWLIGNPDDLLIASCASAWLDYRSIGLRSGTVEQWARTVSR